MLSAPAYDGKVNVWHATALVETAKIGLAKNINVVAVYQPGDALVQRARNDLFKIAYESEVDDLVFIDADVDWQPEDFFRLLAHDVDIVAAPIIKKTDTEKTYSVKLLDDLHVNENGLIRVNGAATGFMRISRRAIKEIFETAPEYSEPGKSGPLKMVFDVRIIDGVLWGEDIFFCERWNELGGEIYIDPSINCGHTGDKRWQSDFIGWLTSKGE